MEKTQKRLCQCVVRIACGCVLSVGSVFGGVGAAKADAKVETKAKFDAGNILSDFLMFNSAAMSREAIENFIEAKGASCVSDGTNICLKDFRAPTTTRKADRYCQKDFGGSESDSAAGIIFKAANACGINPQVLLVTLQKEQGLVLSTTGKPMRTYDRALGFGCPDSMNGECMQQYAGFANQIYSAASRLQQYRINSNTFNYRAGETVPIKFHPNKDCGSEPVTIKNIATAALYNYTPYQPNDAALLANPGALGDECSSYGNKNFSYYFDAWFGGDNQYQGAGASIAGEAKVTKKLKAFPGEWIPGTTVTYQWLLNGDPIAGATGETYKPQPEDQGKKVSVRVTGTLDGFGTHNKKSESIEVIRTEFKTRPVPKIKGALRVGQKLKVDVGKWYPEAKEFHYQWFADGQMISGANKPEFVLSEKMAGKQVYVKITAQRPGFTDAIVVSNRTSPIKTKDGKEVPGAAAKAAKAAKTIVGNPEKPELVTVASPSPTPVPTTEDQSPLSATPAWTVTGIQAPVEVVAPIPVTN